MSRCEGGEFEKIEIEEGSAVWQQVCDFMDDRWRSEYIGIGRDGGGMTHRSFQVKKVWRVENGSLWRRVVNRRAEVEACVEEAPFANSVNKTELELTLDLDELRREVLLFHGSSKEVIDIITRQGFDERLASEKGMFGSGIYFANKSSKADCYSSRHSEASVGETCKMILARVTMGSTYRASSTMKGTRRPPFVEEGFYKLFGSIWFDGSGRNYEEYMV